MRYLCGFLCVCALGLVPLIGCGETQGGGGGGSAGTGGQGGSGGSAGTGGAGDSVAIAGQLFLLSSSGQGVEPADGARVTASLDRDGDGSIEANEQASGLADEDGKYSLRAPAELGRTTVVAFEEDGYAKLIRTVRIESLADVALDGTLTEMEELVCENSRCRDNAGTVSVTGIPMASGYAKVFNPVADADRFPGSFSDNQGNMLISAVFGAFELRNESGDLIEQLEPAEPATITMRVPRDTWEVIVDIIPGDDRVTVPMFYFDETAGDWVMEGTGQIRDAGGVLIAEADLVSIHDGSYSGALFAEAEVTHFSYWNVDWPLEDNTCMGGVVVDEDGKPIKGATGTLRGLNFTGYSQPFTTKEDGSFCVDARRSEKPGEDLDGNGSSGETLSALLTFQNGAKTYRFGETELTTVSARCPSGCTVIEELELVPANEVRPEICSVDGTVRKEGAPVANVVVFAEDELLDPDVAASVCGEACMPAVLSDGSGEFEASNAYATLLAVTAAVTESDGLGSFFYESRRSFLTCPSEPIELNLELGFCFVPLPEISYDDGTGRITWDPPVGAQALIVLSQVTGQLWNLYSDSSFEPPVTYGQVPAGAQQAWPVSGSPEPISSGDLITLTPPNGLIEYEGKMCLSSTSYMVP